MNMKKDLKFSKKIKEVLTMSLCDYNINIKSSEHVKTDMNTSCFTMCFERDKLKDLTISFIFEFSSYLKINIESELDTNINSINFGNTADKRERDGVYCWLIEYIKSYFEKQYEDTVTNITESEHTDIETININKDVAIKYLKTIEAIYAILEQIKLENTNYKLCNLQHNMEKNLFTGESIFSDNIGNNLSLIIKYENNIINISYNDYKNELKTLTFDITYLTLGLMFRISVELNFVIKNEFISKKIDTECNTDIVSDVFVESNINETLFKILKDQPNFRKLKTEIVLYKRELQVGDFRNPFKAENKIFIDAVKGKVNVLKFNIIKEDKTVDTLCEILSCKNNDNLLIKMVGGCVDESEIQYVYLYDLKYYKENQKVHYGIKQMLISILLSYINKLSRNIELKPFNGVSEKSNHDGDFKQTHFYNISEIDLDKISKNVVSLDFTSMENFDFTDEQKDEVIAKITKKANSIIRKEIKKFKAKNKRIEESKIPSDWEIATDSDFKNIISTTSTHLSVVEIDPLAYLVKQLTYNSINIEKSISDDYIHFIVKNIIDERYKGDIEVHYLIHRDINNIIIHNIYYFVTLNGKILFNRNIDTSLLRDYRNFNELILS